MEYDIWRKQRSTHFKKTFSLNPCFNGIWYLTSPRGEKQLRKKSLNPCFNGIWYLTKAKKLIIFEEPEKS